MHNLCIEISVQFLLPFWFNMSFCNWLIHQNFKFLYPFALFKGEKGTPFGWNLPIKNPSKQSLGVTLQWIAIRLIIMDLFMIRVQLTFYVLKPLYHWKSFVQALHQEKASLSTHYGAITGLIELGQEVKNFSFNLLSFDHDGIMKGIFFRFYNFTIIYWQVIKVLILSRLKLESALIKQAQEGVDPVEKNAAENLKTLLLVSSL